MYISKSIHSLEIVKSLYFIIFLTCSELKTINNVFVFNKILKRSVLLGSVESKKGRMEESIPHMFPLI